MTRRARSRAPIPRALAKHLPDRAGGDVFSEFRLEILNRALLEDGADPRSRLAWFVEVTGSALREFVQVRFSSRI